MKINRTFLLGLLFVTALAWTIQAMANPCGSNTTGRCTYNTGTSNVQNQQQGQDQTSIATGGMGGSGGTGGTSTSGSVSSNTSSIQNSESASGGSAGAYAQGGSNTQSTTDVIQRSAPPVALGLIAPNGCGAGAQGGGSNTRGAMMAGFAWTTSECYAFILAQSFQAIGDRESACEILLTTNAAKRAIKRGARFPQCSQPPVTTVVTVQTPGTYTQEQVNAIIRKAVRK